MIERVVVVIYLVGCIAIGILIGLLAMYFAYSPPPLLTELYSAAIGVLSAGLFVPVVAGLWWKRANLLGGVASIVVGTTVYVVVQFTPGTPKLSRSWLRSRPAPWRCGCAVVSAPPSHPTRSRRSPGCTQRNPTHKKQR